MDKDNNRSGILEVKTSQTYGGWNEVPEQYMLQCAHYCYVLDKQFFHFAVLFRGMDYREYGPFEFDLGQYEKEVLPQLRFFWNAVESKTPTFNAVSMADLARITALTDEQVVATDDQLNMIEQCDAANAIM